MKLPYGISDFRKIVSKGYFYCDRTGYIPLLEDAGDYLLFIRPRRFGKSLLMSTLETYYDIRGKERFSEYFGGVAIGTAPTALANSYFILKWDFSCVDPTGMPEDIRNALHDHVNSSIEAFTLYYEEFLPRTVRIDPDNCINSLRSLISVTRMTGIGVYLFIDDYDNFANDILTDPDRQDIFQTLMFDKGPLKTLFKSIKAMAGNAGIDRCLIMGISPIIMNDIASGYSLTKNIFHRPLFNGLCGFREEDIAQAVNTITTEASETASIDIADVLDVLHTWYAGYLFNPESTEMMYNAGQVLYFLESFAQTFTYPRHMLDDNLAADDEKFQFVERIPGGQQILTDLFQSDQYIGIPRLMSPLGLRHVLSDQTRDMRLITSLLYYFGALTLDGTTEKGDLKLKVPNLVIRGLYADHILHTLLPDPVERDLGLGVAQRLYSDGDMEPLCAYVEKRLSLIFNRPDLNWRWSSDVQPLKTIFLSLLYNDALYVMDGDKDVNRSEADLTMMVRSDMRGYDIYDLLIEFKSLPLTEAGLSEEQAQSLSYQELINIPALQLEMGAAKKQLITYGDILEQKYTTTRLRRFSVVALGFERIWWEEL